ncbi:MAG: peptidase M13 [Gemmatimonadota bacterium]|nr:peptidase M13 [Gemmatimonadota bacterium]
MKRFSWLLGAVGVGLLGSGLSAQTASAPRALGVDVANFDRSVRPQDDFFRYLNGGWLQKTPIPADRASYGSFTELADRSEAALRTIIEEAAAAPGSARGSDAQKVGYFYRSYMDTARIETLGVRPLRPELDRIANLGNRAALPEQFAHLQRIGVQTPFSFSVGQDARQADRYIAYVSQSGLGLPDRDYYFNQGAKFAETRTAYGRYVEQLLQLAGERDPAAAARAIVALETKLAGSHWDRVRNRDREATYNLRTVAQLNTMTPGFAWAPFLRAAGGESTPAVVVRQPDYLEALNREFTATPLDTWKQYMRFKLLDSYASVLSRPFVQAQFNFRSRTLQGVEEERPRWKRGVGAVQGAMGEMVGRMYVERNFQPAARARMQQLVDNLMVAFREGIDELEWMSPETKVQAQAKLASFNTKIGYPDQWRDYAALEVRAGDAVGNATRANRFGFQRMVERLGKPIDRTEWGMTPQTVNAYYSSTMNEIVFPAAILQPPFFDLTADDAVNYGAIGGVIGHEISHGFDDQGSRSDGQGNLRDWWSPADAAAFKERTERLAAQYSRFCPLEGLCVNGRVALGENIGDLSGLTVAHKAYRKSLGGREAPVIGGFTGDQRFFMGWGQIWRTQYREEALRQQLMVGPHSPAMFRVNGVLPNMPEFYAAFNVKPGDKMYLPPEQRVKIW